MMYQWENALKLYGYFHGVGEDKQAEEGEARGIEKPFSLT